MDCLSETRKSFVNIRPNRDLMPRLSNEDFRELFKFGIAAKGTEIYRFKLVHLFMNKCGNTVKA